MARVEIATYDLPGVKDTDGTVVTPTTGDSTDDHYVDFQGKDILLVAEASGSATVTVVSVADPRFGRTGDHSLAMTTGQTAIFGPYSRVGWRQSTDGYLHVDVDSTDVTLYAVRI